MSKDNILTIIMQINFTLFFITKPHTKVLQANSINVQCHKLFFNLPLRIISHFPHTQNNLLVSCRNAQRGFVLVFKNR